VSNQFIEPQKIVETYRFIFDAFPTLKCLPIYGWGRYYKYELSGEPFELDDYSFEDFKSVSHHNWSKLPLDWDLLAQVSQKLSSNEDPELTLKYEDLGCFERREWAFDYGDGEERGGVCAFVVKTGNELSLKLVKCDSPE